MNTFNTTAKVNAKPSIQRVLLVDDDEDDCLLFAEALTELQISAQFTSVNNGEKLMLLLGTSLPLPDLIFLDMNMPGKNGLQCLVEIKAIERLAAIPVVIISTSLEQSTIATLYEHGALLYIKKPNQFQKLKEVIRGAISLAEQPLAIDKQPLCSG